MAKEFSKAFYRSKQWQEARDYILKRDRFFCVRCGEPATDVHHKIRLTPENIGDIRIALHESNLESLCDECHKAEHREERTGVRSEFVFDQDGQPIPIDRNR